MVLNQHRYALTVELAERNVGSIVLQVNIDRNDVISSVIAAARTTTVRSVILCVASGTVITLVESARQDDLLHSHHEWLVVCDGPPEARLSSVLPKTSNVAWLIHAEFQATSNTTLCQTTAVDDDPQSSGNRSDSFALCSFDTSSGSSLTHVGSWTSTSGLIVIHDVIYPNIFRHFGRATLRVGAWEAPPFLRRVSSEVGVEYKGFCVDLLDEIASVLNFTYVFVEPGDGQYGAPDGNGSWNGMVGMMLKGELDMAIGPFTITPGRKSVIDFTVPFMEDGGGILTKGGDPLPDMMNVFRPFPVGVWLVTGAAVIVTGLILFCITKAGTLSFFRAASEGEGDRPWTLRECLLVIFGSLVSQGAPRHPKSSAGRLVLGCWWLFTILIVSIYTATLAAMLTVTVKTDTIDSIDDLARSSLDPVTITGSNWHTMFLTAESGVYKEIGQRMARGPEAKVNDDVLPLVREGRAAFLLDVNQILYLYSEDCRNLHMAKTTFNNNGLGFALPRHAHYRDAMNNVLQEGGFTEIWRQRWWPTPTDCGPKGPSVSEARQLDVVSIGGILIMYGVVIGLAVFCLLLQFLVHSDTFRRAIKEETQEPRKTWSIITGQCLVPTHPPASLCPHLPRLDPNAFTVHDEVREKGFTVILDMRGSKWETVKPILKALQECFPGNIHMAYIIKPERFWEKQRTSLGSAKYNFETNMISLDNLTKVIDSSQLTREFDGTLEYDHEQWIQLRLMLEEFIWKALDLLDKLDELGEILTNPDLPDDLGGAQHVLEEHNHLKRRVTLAPVEQLSMEGHHILTKITGEIPGQSGSVGRRQKISGNADFQSAVPQISQLLENLQSTKQHLNQLWVVKKMRLEQCLQLRIFEEDVEKMFDWISHNRDLFLVNYTEIGTCHQMAVELESEHCQFATSAENVYVNITRILGMAQRMCDSGHYASNMIRVEAGRLEREWKSLAAALEDRSNVLRMSVVFHKKAEQYLAQVIVWQSTCENTKIPTQIEDLEEALQAHQDLIETISQTYAEVCGDGKALLDTLQTPVSSSSANSITAKADYSEAAGHVLDVVHEVLAHQRHLEHIWHTKKVKLHQRLGLRLFQQDVKQVIDWLNNHGDVFLKKNTSIGKTLQRAKALQKSHEHFESVARNTITNADKLLAAADELAQTGECDPKEIYGEAHELEQRMHNFLSALERRRAILDMTVAFYTHVHELTNWLEDLHGELQSSDIADTVEGAEQLIGQFNQQRQTTLEAAINTVSEGQTLLEQLRTRCPENAER
nr:hypothetical protein BaRGS_000325 [Batillaria attramentaria]